MMYVCLRAIASMYDVFPSCYPYQHLLVPVIDDDDPLLLSRSKRL